MLCSSPVGPGKTGPTAEGHARGSRFSVHSCLDDAGASVWSSGIPRSSGRSISLVGVDRIHVGDGGSCSRPVRSDALREDHFVVPMHGFSREAIPTVPSGGHASRARVVSFGRPSVVHVNGGRLGSVFGIRLGRFDGGRFLSWWGSGAVRPPLATPGSLVGISAFLASLARGQSSTSGVFGCGLVHPGSIHVHCGVPFLLRFHAWWCFCVGHLGP
mmetsp:Transcript_5762/g.35815  ORF Transcript_5762/g.35815 Transcript_5762/m.35815 type:complete len:215 (-) Transcript_5762:94-738(-)